MQMRRLRSADPDFYARLDALLARDADEDSRVTDTVTRIVQDIRRRGDGALLEYTNYYDRRQVSKPEDLEVSPDTLRAALDGLAPQLRQALEQAVFRIRAYHEHQKQDSWTYRDADGSLLGQQVTPMERVGVYVPGGKAAYPSSVLMNTVPAKVAGVAEILMVVPAPDDELNQTVLAAAALAGVDRVFTVGGAQAVAALAYGTELVPSVDKIVGPGNVYVASAKAMVFGKVGIDMIAGPSEILVVADGHTNPEWVVFDLFSQAEHDEQAQAILLSPDADLLDQVENVIVNQLGSMERAEIIRVSLENRGALIRVTDLDEAAAIVDYIAPEHVELSVANPEALSRKIRHAGAIFMGRYTAEVLGDYCAGPNHVLPTSRTARFASPLGVYDFQKRSSLIMCSKESASELGAIASVLARAEGLTAHARSAECRMRHEVSS